MAVNAGPNIVEDGLILYLDAANRRSYPGSGTAWTDLSGNNNTSTLQNGPSYNSQNNGFIVFDGSNDVGEITSSPSIEVSGNITIDVWMYLLSSIAGAVISKGPISTDYDYMVYYSDNGPRLAFFKKDTLGVVDTAQYTTTILNRWVHTCWVYNGSTIIGYENGVQATSAAASGNIRTSSVSLKIGAGWVTYRNCHIAQTKIYNRALTATEVLQNFEATRGRFEL